ncbi:uncharacterized protein LOC143277922 isoform X2 [Babylonia areolata]|uniref:uncharacterized protein LOC143277922 isoform X2 n=1 Tax=Babylonia areolata TaxID=304850 RepID=UPI003FD0A40B
MVDKETIERFVQVSKRINEAEGKSTNKLLKQKKDQLADVAQTVKTLEEAYKKATESVEKEKGDVDRMKQPSTRDFFKDQKSFDEQMSVEQEEYLEAVSKQEMVKKQLDGVTQQKKQLEQEVAECGKQMETLMKLYDQQDEILGQIFNGEYGSDLENKLESEFDSVKERKERILVAKYKWSNAKILLQHAVKQLGVASTKWMEILKVEKSNVQGKYFLATETRNNIIAAAQNITAAQGYLNNIKFPYCEKEEIKTLNRACEHVFSDMQSNSRHQHAHQCFHVTYRRAAALLQWFESVINNTIAKDLEAAKKELAPVEKSLREERLRLIKEKLGSDADSIVLPESDSDFDEQAEDPELLAVCQAEKVEGSDNTLGVDDSSPKAPTPLPLTELAPAPSQEDLFGNIEQLKQQHEKEMAEFEKAQETNKARMEQGLQEKLAARRNRRARMGAD